LRFDSPLLAPGHEAGNEAITYQHEPDANRSRVNQFHLFFFIVVGRLFRGSVRPGPRRVLVFFYPRRLPLGGGGEAELALAEASASASGSAAGGRAALKISP
jgi:hypothetical protein